MEPRVTMSLELLLLNDLFQTGVIDRTLYDKAAKKIISMSGTMQNNKKPEPITITIAE